MYALDFANAGRVGDVGEMLLDAKSGYHDHVTWDQRHET